MRKLLSMLIAAVFAVSMGSVFAASNMKVAAGEKTDEMKTEQMHKAEKKEKKATKKAAKKAKRAKAQMKQDEAMKKDAEKK